MSKFSALLALSLSLCVGAMKRVRMEADVNTFSAPNWERVERADPLDVISPVFVLRHGAEQKAVLDSLVLERSTPGSPTYGKWLNQADLKELIAPPEEAVQVLKDFLHSFGVKHVSVNTYRDVIKTKMTVADAEKMFETSMYKYRSLVDPLVTVIRVGGPYSLPEDVAELVYVVEDILRLPRLRKAKFVPAPTSESLRGRNLADDEFSSCGTKCAGFTTPDVLEAAYNYETLSTYTTGNSVAVAEFQLQYYDNTDLSSFNASCDADATVATTVGGNVPQVCTVLGGCVEALLDIEYVGAVSAPIPLTAWYQGEYSLLTWITDVLELTSPPLVHSVSYGNDEAQQTSVDYMYSCDVQFEKAASRGLSILFASGDQGVWGREGTSGTVFHPDFPASSQYITAVGGTNFVTKSTIGEEEVWNCGGGGFSDTFGQPSWQSDAVTAYLATATLPSSSLYNSSGRAYPDVSALGGGTNPYCVAYSGGSFGGVYGTSASCPVVAGIFALLNDVRLSLGKSSLGWLNPLIYGAAASANCFNDVTQGENNCISGTTGFSAQAGWDPASGWGTPDYGCLAALVATL